MQLRAVELFVEVARERSYTRAAAACGVSESVLSKTVKALEAKLGQRLFRRGGSHGLALTEFGAYFLEQTGAALDSGAAFRQLAAQLSVGSAGSIAIGWPAHGLGRLGALILRALRDELPDLTVATVHPDLDGGPAALETGRCDLLLVRHPVEQAHLTGSEHIAQEVRLLGRTEDVVLPDDVSLDALVGTPIVPCGELVGAGDVWGPFPTLHGEPVFVPVPPATEVEELFDRVRRQDGLCLVPDGLAEFYRPDGLRFTPLYDAAASFARFVWRTDDTSPGVAAALPVVERVCGEHPELGGLRRRGTG